MLPPARPARPGSQSWLLPARRRVPLRLRLRLHGEGSRNTWAAGHRFSQGGLELRRPVPRIRWRKDYRAARPRRSQGCRPRWRDRNGRGDRLGQCGERRHHVPPCPVAPVNAVRHNEDVRPLALGRLRWRRMVPTVSAAPRKSSTVEPAGTRTRFGDGDCRPKGRSHRAGRVDQHKVGPLPVLSSPKLRPPPAYVRFEQMGGDGEGKLAVLGNGCGVAAGSASSTATVRPRRCNSAARLSAVVVLPTPPCSCATRRSSTGSVTSPFLRMGTKPLPSRHCQATLKRECRCQLGARIVSPSPSRQSGNTARRSLRQVGEPSRRSASFKSQSLRLARVQRSARSNSQPCHLDRSEP